MGIALQILFGVIGICICTFFYVLYLKFIINAYKKQKSGIGDPTKNIENKEKWLSNNGFIISRRIGDYNKLWGVTAYYLYLDDVNKKWFITSPILSENGMIREYSDLLDYEFFDEDSKNIANKIGQLAVGFSGVITGGAIGGLVGAVGGGIGTSKSTKIMPGGNGESVAYGLAVATKDCDINNPMFILDFASVARQSLEQSNDKIDRLVGKFMKISNETKITGTNRNSQRYKKNIEVIRQMAEVFDYIIRTNLQ